MTPYLPFFRALTAVAVSTVVKAGRDLDGANLAGAKLGGANRVARGSAGERVSRGDAVTAEDADRSLITISAGDLTTMLDRSEDERDAALAENARLRRVLLTLCDAADVALRRIDGYDAILDPLSEAVDAARNEMAKATP